MTPRKVRAALGSRLERFHRAIVKAIDQATITLTALLIDLPHASGSIFFGNRGPASEDSQTGRILSVEAEIVVDHRTKVVDFPFWWRCFCES